MSVAPTGTVTFLFTDIEGSTKLWEKHPDAMRRALVRHDDLLRGCIEGREGYVFKTVGDAFCAAFPTANRALEAALAAQLDLAAEPWETETPLLVRMALHTGACEERGGDYFGQTLNRTARLMAAGHGGQVLLSDVTQGLVRDALPPTVSLLSLDEHRLKDLGRPERVFQLLHPALPADFPALRSLDHPDLPNNLPQQPTSFIGRETQIDEAKARLAKTRLLTLTGSGGSGKTRLSLQIAADYLDQYLDQYHDGVWLVELAALTDPALVPQAVAQVLGAREEPGRPIQQTLVEALKAKRLLLVLDNCEHLVAACASLVADLLRNCPDVHLLASSREPLNASGEQTYRVPSLTLPDPKQAQTVESLSQFEAVRLFIERAQAVQSSFVVTNQNAQAVAQVCFRLDGIPLAIELAAARVRSLSVEEVNTRLGHRFRLLTGGSRTVLPRQQTLRALIDWSYDLLTEAEKTLLRRLSVFAGGWPLAAVEKVCAGEYVEEWEVVDLLTGLVDKSLAMYEEGADGAAGRYRLLETIRQYAGDRLGESGKSEDIRGRHQDFFLGIAEEAERNQFGSGQNLWLNRLETEQENLRAALSASLDENEGTEAGLRLTGALTTFWYRSGQLHEGRQHFAAALTRATSVSPTQARAKALCGAGVLAQGQGDHEDATDLLRQSLAISQALGDRAGCSLPLRHLGGIAWRRGNFTEAGELYSECLAIQRQFDLPAQAVTLWLLGLNASSLGERSLALSNFRQCLALSQKQGDLWTTMRAYEGLAAFASEEGDYEAAQQYCEKGLAFAGQTEDRRAKGGLLLHWASAMWH